MEVYKELILVIVSVFVPPLAVWLKRGLGRDVVVNVVLFVLGFFPALLHALWVVAKSDKRRSSGARRQGGRHLHRQPATPAPLR